MRKVKNYTIRKLAQSRLRHKRSHTLFTAIAILFTTILLMALGTTSVGLMDMTRQQAVSASNQHAVFVDLTKEQVAHLNNHLQVEAIVANEMFASVQFEKMNGYLQFKEAVKGEIFYGVGNLTEGRMPTAPDEICGPPAFFERLGVEPVLGNTLTISFRPGGDQALAEQTFTICGLVSQVDVSRLDVDDSRIAYSAYIAESLVQEYLPEEERLFRASIRVSGEDSLSYDEIQERIQSIAEAIGYAPQRIDFNGEYLLTVTDPGSEMFGIVAGLGLMICLFSGLVIYSIYYVSVITEVQEIGKLKALGASRSQIRSLLLREGMTVTLVVLPAGLLLGYLIPYLVLPWFANRAVQETVTAFVFEKIHMFSLPVLLVVVLVVFLTVFLSLLKPIRIAAKVSPIEAIRYQESSRGKGGIRKGYDAISPSRLCAANLLRNRRRTVVTMLTMGLSCVLFMGLAGLMNSLSPEDIARRSVPMGDFHISLDYAQNDWVYPENNLDSLSQQELFGDALSEQLAQIEGLSIAGTAQTLLASSDYPSPLFEDGNRATLSFFTREDAKKYEKVLERGELDYDRMVAENGVIFTSDYFFEDYELQIGDTLSLTLYDGTNQIPLTVRLSASMDDADSQFLIPQEVFENLNLQFDATTDLYLSAEPKYYETAKEALQNLCADSPKFRMNSIDEELRIGRMSVGMIKYPLYAILIIIAVIGFINLINTMVTSIVTRKRELGILQAVGLSNRQLTRLLAQEGIFFIAGTLLLASTLGNLFGYRVFLWGRDSHFMSVSAYHFPVWETLGLFTILVLGQLFITLYIRRQVRKESLVERIRSGES